jgi:hypothetical protein
MKKSLGIPAQFKLAEGAVPTSKAPSIWESTSNDVDSTAETSCDVPQDRKSGGAFHKRERARILQEIKGESEKQAPIAEQEIIQPLPMVKYTCVLLLMYIN